MHRGLDVRLLLYEKRDTCISNLLLFVRFLEKHRLANLATKQEKARKEKLYVITCSVQPCMDFSVSLYSLRQIRLCSSALLVFLYLFMSRFDLLWVHLLPALPDSDMVHMRIRRSNENQQRKENKTEHAVIFTNLFYGIVGSCFASVRERAGQLPFVPLIWLPAIENVKERRPRQRKSSNQLGPIISFVSVVDDS